MNQRRFSDPVEEQDIAASTDRRDGDRYRTVWRIAKVMRNGDAGLWRVRNISHRGLVRPAAVPIAGRAKLAYLLFAIVAPRGDDVSSSTGRHGVLFEPATEVPRLDKKLG